MPSDRKVLHANVWRAGERETVEVVATATERPPYEAYAVIVGAFGGLLATAGLVGRALRRDPQCQSAFDFALLSLASFKAARTLSRDQVTSFLREPFVESRAGAAADEEPVQSGDIEQAIGELVTCTRCIGTWAAAGLAATQIIAPRFGRLVTLSLGAAAVNDFLQAGFSSLSAQANRREQE